MTWRRRFAGNSDAFPFAWPWFKGTCVVCRSLAPNKVKALGRMTSSPKSPTPLCLGMGMPLMVPYSSTRYLPQLASQIFWTPSSSSRYLDVCETRESSAYDNFACGVVKAPHHRMVHTRVSSMTGEMCVMAQIFLSLGDSMVPEGQA